MNEKQFYTYSKTGEWVQVDSSLAKQLVQSGKKRPEDFEIVDNGLTQSTNLQEAGPTIEPSSILPRVEDVPELAMSTGMGMLAAGKSTPAGAALVGLASAGGEAYKQLGQRAGFIPGVPPQTTGEAMSGIAQAGARGLISEPISRGVGALISKSFRPFRRSVTPEMMTTVKQAENEGIKLTPAMVSDSPYVIGSERLAETTPIIGSKVTRLRKEAISGFENLVNKSAQGLGDVKTSAELSNMVDGRIGAVRKSFNEAKEKVYEEIMPKISSLKPKTDATLNKATEIVNKWEGTLSPSGLSKVKEILKDVTPYDEVSKIDSGGLPTPFVNRTQKINIKDIGEMRRLRTKLGKLIDSGFQDPALTGLDSDLKGLYGAITNDIDETIKAYDQKLYDPLKQADRMYADGINKFKRASTKQIMRIARDNPDGLPEAVFKPRRGEWINQSREILGDKTFNQIRSKWFDDIVERSQNVDTNKVDAKKLVNNLEKYRSVFGEIFPDNPRALKDLEKVIKIGKAVQKDVPITAGSQTALIQTVISIKNGIRGAISTPMITTETGRKWLTSGYNVPSRPIQRGMLPIIQRTGQYLEQ